MRLIFSLDAYSGYNHELPESLVWNYIVDLLMAIKHLHDNDLVHLDIKPVGIKSVFDFCIIIMYISCFLGKYSYCVYRSIKIRRLWLSCRFETGKLHKKYFMVNL